MDVSTTFFLLLLFFPLSSSCSLPLFQGKGWGRGNVFLLLKLALTFLLPLLAIARFPPRLRGKAKEEYFRGDTINGCLYNLLLALEACSSFPSLLLAPCPCFRGRVGEGVTSSCSWSLLLLFFSPSSLSLVFPLVWEGKLRRKILETLYNLLLSPLFFLLPAPVSGEGLGKG